MSSKITDLTVLTGAGAAPGDLLVAVDISDTTMAASGTSKKITFPELLIGIAALPKAGGVMSGTITSTMETITADTPALTATQTWNAAGTTFRGIFLNVTNTASAAASKLLDLQVGGLARFSVATDGQVTVGNILTASGFVIAGSTGSWFGGLFRHPTTGLMQWSTTANSQSGSYDTGLGKNAAGIIEVNNGTAGTFRDMKLRNIELTGTLLGFYGATPATKPTATGSRGGNAALASLLTQLATLGLITDSTS